MEAGEQVNEVLSLWSMGPTHQQRAWAPEGEYSPLKACHTVSLGHVEKGYGGKSITCKCTLLMVQQCNMNAAFVLSPSQHMKILLLLSC